MATRILGAVPTGEGKALGRSIVVKASIVAFADGPGAKHFAAASEDVSTLVIPTICLLAVFTVVRRV